MQSHMFTMGTRTDEKRKMITHANVSALPFAATRSAAASDAARSIVCATIASGVVVAAYLTVFGVGDCHELTTTKTSEIPKVWV